MLSMGNKGFTKKNWKTTANKMSKEITFQEMLEIANKFEILPGNELKDQSLFLTPSVRKTCGAILSTPRMELCQRSTMETDTMSKKRGAEITRSIMLKKKS